MNPRLLRKVEILDLIILVAATAIGLTAIRYYLTTTWGLRPTIDAQGMVSFITITRPIARTELATIGSLLLAAWSPALLWIWFRSPRTSPWAMIQHPGVLAATVATLVVIAFLGWHLRGGWPTMEVPAKGRGGQIIIGSLDLFPTFVLDEMRQFVGSAVVASWVALVAKGRWRASADWIDRSGLILGMGWLLLFIESL